MDPGDLPLNKTDSVGSITSRKSTFSRFNQIYWIKKNLIYLYLIYKTRDIMKIFLADFFFEIFSQVSLFGNLKYRFLDHFPGILRLFLAYCIVLSCISIISPNKNKFWSKTNLQFFHQKYNFFDQILIEKYLLTSKNMFINHSKSLKNIFITQFFLEKNLYFFLFFQIFYHNIPEKNMFLLSRLGRQTLRFAGTRARAFTNVISSTASKVVDKTKTLTHESKWNKFSNQQKNLVIQKYYSFKQDPPWWEGKISGRREWWKWPGFRLWSGWSWV